MGNEGTIEVPGRGTAEWWESTLSRLNEVLLHAPWLAPDRDRLPPEAVDRGWLGRPGASASELAELESRLGLRLCPSYRALLEVSNGFARFGEFIGRLLPSFEVDWYEKRNPGARTAVEEWLRAGNPLKPPYMEEPRWREDIPLRSIEVAENVEVCALLLHPEATDRCEEWEIWLQMTGSIQRYETLPDYMDAVLEALGHPPDSAFGPIAY